MAETLSGIIERITFHNPDNGFVVLRVQARGQRGLVAVIGNCPSVTTGEYIEAEGEWVNDRDHGAQFKAESLRCTPPHTKEGIEKYLGSGLVKGIGPRYAKRIVEVFGERTLEVIDASPSFLKEVKGIGTKLIQRIRESWQEQKAVRGIMVFLQANGIGTARAIRIYKTYGDQAVEMVRANPYRLASDVWGFGFQTADELALRLGLDRNSPHRARAAVRFVLQEQSHKGHVAYPEVAVLQDTQAKTDIGLDILKAAIEAEREEGAIVRDGTGDEAWLYLKILYLAETGIGQAFAQLRKGLHPLGKVDTEAALRWVERRIGLELAPAQREAIGRATREKVSIVTGGPGVGKTTIVRGILEIFVAKGQVCALAAPTGRAAKRLTETTGQEAKTLHRLLEFDPMSGGFRRDPSHPLDLDLLVVDEASMVDISLMYHLARALPRKAALVLVGDVDQLPSVGPGRVLGDLIASKAVPVVWLTEIFRQAEQSWIVRAAHAINRGRLPESAPAGQGDFYFVEAETPPAIMDKVLTLVRERIPARFGLDPLRDVQVLTPMNRGELGARALNERLQGILNPAREVAEIERFGWKFRVGDKVMQTHNDYQKEVFNGDIGLIAEINEEDRDLIVSFDGRRVIYAFGELDELALAYALTIHKSQGSEYPAVVIPLHTQHYMMLQRNLLYTGITRGRKLVVVVGSRKALEMAVGRQDMSKRTSALCRRMREAHGLD